MIWIGILVRKLLRIRLVPAKLCGPAGSRSEKLIVTVHIAEHGHELSSISLPVGQHVSLTTGVHCCQVPRRLFRHFLKKFRYLAKKFRFRFYVKILHKTFDQNN